MRLSPLEHPKRIRCHVVPRPSDELPALDEAMRQPSRGRTSAVIPRERGYETPTVQYRRGRRGSGHTEGLWRRREGPRPSRVHTAGSHRRPWAKPRGGWSPTQLATGALQRGGADARVCLGSDTLASPRGARSPPVEARWPKKPRRSGRVPSCATPTRGRSSRIPAA
ncbi:hypothetical protein HNY73_003681 [Argiope bruennichi]|uniref:Uncharacterized protein n=1 Tax=Argiope bruennichi TaxID=94029 RepID=A0A8T0FRB9_ARGBR|nr:hypothetical protein HNY73_003681 [Argiope bruennichi]